MLTRQYLEKHSGGMISSLCFSLFELNLCISSKLLGEKKSLYCIECVLQILEVLADNITIKK